MQMQHAVNRRQGLLKLAPINPALCQPQQGVSIIRVPRENPLVVRQCAGRIALPDQDAGIRQMGVPIVGIQFERMEVKLGSLVYLDHSLANKATP